MLTHTGLAPWSLPFSTLLALLKDLWTGLSSLLHRHLQQSGALTMDVLQDPPPGPVEGVDEDIADKVGPGPVAGPAGVVGEVCRVRWEAGLAPWGLSRPQQPCWSLAGTVRVGSLR